MRMVLAIGFLAATAAVAADAPAAVLGRWGSAAQCAQAPLLAGGTLLAAPFEVSEDWLRHRDTWCRLTWFAPVARDDGLFVSSQALCGEDAARSYRLDFALQGKVLRLIWDEARLNGPLRRC